MDSRTRVVTEAMRLFGEQGYTKTTIAEIEKAAGLSPGSGALYRHFRSKKDVLTEGLRSMIASNAELMATLGDNRVSTLPLREQLAALARAGLRRLDQERDLNRILVRDLAAFPELLEEVRAGELRRTHAAMAQWLRAHAGPRPEEPEEPDWDALAVMLVGSISHFWLLRDVFGGAHPSGLDEDRCVEAVTEFAVRLLTPIGVDR